MIFWTHGSACPVYPAADPSHEPSVSLALANPYSLAPDERYPDGALDALHLRPRAPHRRIAIVTGNYLNVTDGVSRTLHRLVDYLRRRGNEVLVVGPSARDDREGLASKQDGPSAPSGDIPVPAYYISAPSIPMPGRPEYRLALGLPQSVARRLTAFAPDLVHVTTPDLLGIGAIYWGRSHGVPVVATYHTHFPAYLTYYGLGMLRRPLEHYLRWFYGRCRRVYIPTLSLAEYFETLGCRIPLRAWGRGVDRSAFNPGLRSESWRRDLGVRPDDVLVTFVGRLVREKGLDVFASIVERFRVDGVRSMIVGDGPLRRKLATRLPETLFTGHLEGSDLGRAFASSDVFLFPSDSEAFGNVIVEAMASGLPVVCAESPCSSHVVHGRTGFIAPAGDVESFVHHVRHLVRRPRERNWMSVQARLRAARYDWNRTLSRMIEYYEEVLEDAESGGAVRQHSGATAATADPAARPVEALEPAK